MAGYSQTTLFKKMGIKKHTKLLVVNAPVNYLELLGAGIENQLVYDMRDANMAHIFAQHSAALAKHFAEIVALADKDAVIWVSWHKKAAQIPTDITDDVIRAIVLPTGWVDVKVCAVSDVWSGLKIVKRLVNRR